MESCTAFTRIPNPFHGYREPFYPLSDMFREPQARAVMLHDDSVPPALPDLVSILSPHKLDKGYCGPILGVSLSQNNLRKPIHFFSRQLTLEPRGSNEGPRMDYYSQGSSIHVVSLGPSLGPSDWAYRAQKPTVPLFQAFHWGLSH